MADIRIEGPDDIEVTEENAADFQETYEKLASLPNNRKASTIFDTAAEARDYCKQGRAWAAQNGLVFQRKGDVKGDPTRVRFRIYVPKASGDDSTGDAEE